MSDSIANGYGCRPCKQVQLNVTDAIIHFIGDGSALSHLNASNVDFGTLSTTVFPASSVTAGTYGSSSNVSQFTVDQYGRLTAAANVAFTASSQWTGAVGSSIYYIPGVSIGSSDDATANLQVTGNVYVSNAVTTMNVFATRYYGDGGLLSNIASSGFTQPLANLVVSNSVTTTNVFAATEVLTGTTDQTTLNITGNVYVSNAVTTTNVFANIYYGDGGLLSNVGSQWTGNKGSPIYYIPGVGVGSSTPATANLQVAGNVYVSNAVTTSNVNITDTLDVVGSMTANAANATFFFDTFTIPYINTQYLNVLSNTTLTGNLVVATANIETLNVGYLTVNSALVYGTSTLNVYGVSNLSTVTARTMNVYGDCFIGNTAITGSVQTTTGPMSRLTFDNTANTSIYPNKIVLYANTASSQYCGFGVTGIGPTGGASISYGARANHIFYTGTTLTTEVMRITSSSIVGLGTTTPTAKFHVVGNIYASNALTTTNVFATTANIATTNTQVLDVSSVMNFTGPLATLSNLYVPGNANIEYLSVSNLAVTGNLYITATNVQTTNALTINNSGTMTALKVTQNETSIHTHNVAEFWDATTLAMVIDPEGNVAIHTVSSPGYALTVTDPANFETLYVRGKNDMTSLNVAGNVYVSNALTVANAYISNIYTSNIVGFVGSQWTGTTDQPITYTPFVGIGSSSTPTSNLQVTGNLYVSTTIQYGEDLVRRAPHLVPSASNAGVITAWVSGTCNAVSVQGSFWATPSVPAVSNIAIGPPGLDSYTGSVLLNNGRVLFVPSAASSGIGLFNPATDQYSVVAPAGSTLTGGYSGGVLVPNGNVVFVSNTATSIGVYNPMTLTFSSAPAHKCATPAFFGGTLGPNSNVIMVPSTGHSNIGEYSPTTGVYSNAVATGTLGGYAGAVLIPNGNVVCIPWNSSNIGQYDYVTRTFSNSLSVDGQFAGGVLVPNGTVVCVPSTLSNVVVFDPVTNAASNIIAASGFFGGVLMPTGNIVCIPSTNSNVGWIDPVRLTYSNIVPQSTFGGNAFRGGTLLPDGRVIFCPYDATNVAGIQSLTPAPVEFCRSPYFNKF